MQRSFEDVLYDRLTTDKYGRWKEIFGNDLLRKVCERMAEEAERFYIEDLARLMRDLEEEISDLEYEKSCLEEYSQDVTAGLRP